MIGCQPYLSVVHQKFWARQVHFLNALVRSERAEAGIEQNVVFADFFRWKNTHSSEIKPGFNCNDTNRIQYIHITFDEQIQQVQLIRCGFVVCFQCLQVARNAVGMMSSRLRPTKLLRSSDPLLSGKSPASSWTLYLVSPCFVSKIW